MVKDILHLEVWRRVGRVGTPPRPSLLSILKPIFVPTRPHHIFISSDGEVKSSEKAFPSFLSNGHTTIATDMTDCDRMALVAGDRITGGGG